MLKAYYYLLYKFYRTQQALSRGPFGERHGLHLNAALMLALLIVWPICSVLIRHFGGFIAGLMLGKQTKVLALVLFFFGPLLMLTACNYYLFRRPIWYKYIVEFRGYPRRQRDWGTLKILGYILLFLASSCMAFLKN
ncbi:hypothetical protein F0P96_13450 [Hymenobacter busanensis]|uniref:Uncharacterized protein n=1 Tax=Hymenobacter busanensis TaxID=2607656 RepID=A0A7L4ZVE9_9BACT|nr:hypothetical protein [Hymenobacter busanensis]KAA9332471.1 hypothetical protein F0P96_13450 [Hymenobacter busanensis]QHJ07191.1 hypothetical protein GUY19_07820 [Hymenobacter busanensis]